MPNDFLRYENKINIIIKSTPKAEIKAVSSFNQCNIVALIDDEHDVVYYIDKKNCERDEELDTLTYVLKTFNKRIGELDFLCFLKVKNEKYIKKICNYMTFF